MTWLERKKNWSTEGGRLRRPKNPVRRTEPELVYSVTQAAAYIGVTRNTIFKYLSIDEPEGAVIPAHAWYRLPSGHIRIREWILKELKGDQN
ncbi:MAG: hypothetical protein JXL84_20485 [Deltaproteobacteria bacterium]|nr:hypothetical protein [Deltaproteobacteria bacterium]